MRITPLTDSQFERLRVLLARAAGLAFDPSRRDSLSYSVAERLRVTGLPDADAYLDALTDPVERQRLLDEVTIQETHFFRNPPQIRALRQHVLPALVRAAAGTRRLRVWSAGCSTGEEPYTIAMMLRELLPSTSGWDLQVLGTDVSERALDAARTARYGARSVQMASASDLARFFVQHPDGSAEVRPEVRELVTLRHHNLVTEPVPFAPGEVDLVLCRNVTIYFAKETTRALMGRLHASLRDGGYLFLGHSETLWQVSEDFRLVPLGSGDDAAFVYRRMDGPERRAVLPDRRTADDGPPVPDRRVAPRRLAPSTGLPGAVRPGSVRPDSARPDSARPDAGQPGDPGRPGDARRDGGASSLGPVQPPDRPFRAGGPPAPRPDPVRPGALRPPAPDRSRSPVALAAAPGPGAGVPQVRAALAEGRYDDAVALADALAAGSPMLSDAHYLRGLALVSLGQDAGALVALRKAVYLDPTSGLAHFLLAGTLARTGDPAAACREYAAAAATLSSREATAPELGGRDLRELVALCHRLSEPPEEPS